MASLTIKRALANSFLIAFSISISLLLGEAVVRIIFDPVDYLEAYLVDDDILSHKIKPNSSGHDSWGFRNKTVPTSPKIVTIGDSQTYGISASAKNSWPAHVQKLVHQDVYNLSLGGYGPVQYYYLLKSKALDLRPSLIVAGFYLGNDLFDAYNMVYTKEYWRYLRRPNFAIEEKGRSNSKYPKNALQRKFMGDLRDWLAHHSVLYRMITFSFGNTFRLFEMKYVSSTVDTTITVFETKQLELSTGFTPSLRLSALNLRDPKIREGLRITLELFQEMNDLCSNKGIDFLIAVIPTKESVFGDYILNERDLNNSDVIRQLIMNEQQVRISVKRYLEQHNISYIDLLPALENAVGTKVIYPANDDGHPSAEGYEVIAKTIRHFLMDSKRLKINALVH